MGLCCRSAVWEGVCQTCLLTGRQVLGINPHVASQNRMRMWDLVVLILIPRAGGFSLHRPVVYMIPTVFWRTVLCLTALELMGNSESLTVLCLFHKTPAFSAALSCCAPGSSCSSSPGAVSADENSNQSSLSDVYQLKVDSSPNSSPSPQQSESMSPAHTSDFRTDDSQPPTLGQETLEGGCWTGKGGGRWLGSGKAPPGLVGGLVGGLGTAASLQGIGDFFC